MEKKLASERLVSLSLTAEAMEFPLGVAESVSGALCGGGAHSLNELPWAWGMNDCNRKKGEKVKETDTESAMLPSR